VVIASAAELGAAELGAAGHDRKILFEMSMMEEP
jgi:hypothetical protein